MRNEEKRHSMVQTNRKFLSTTTPKPGPVNLKFAVLTAVKKLSQHSAIIIFLFTLTLASRSFL